DPSARAISPARDAAEGPLSRPSGKRKQRYECVLGQPETAPTAARGTSQGGLIRNANPVRGDLLTAQQYPPATVGVQPDPGELPSAVLGLDRQSGGCADPRQIRWQPQRYPLVLVRQIAFPALWHPSAVHGSHR